MIKRSITEHFLRCIQNFPVVILTGARQTGKSTLCKELLANTHRYISLEDPDIRRQALDDPRTFLQTYTPPVILDEIQYAPELPSYIQTIVDEKRHQYGQYILTGSQNFLLIQQVSQSLAGRAALLTLHPCAVSEVDVTSLEHRASPQAMADWILRGGYPELRARPTLNREDWCASYIRLYVERDVRQIIHVTDLAAFERFIHQVALRSGQILNMSNLARDVDVSVATATRWLSVLQASYQVFLLQPYHTNISKRYIKAPKMYFGDTALASFLMGIHDAEVLLKGPQLGALFETAVVLEHIKQASMDKDVIELTYLRTHDGIEVDVIIEKGTTLFAREVKSTRTLTSSVSKQLLAVEHILRRPIDKVVLAPVEQEIQAYGATIRPWVDVKWER